MPAIATRKTTMKAVRIHSFGGPDVLRLEEAPKPEPKHEEVLVRVYAASVNPVDWKIQGGKSGQVPLPIHHRAAIFRVRSKRWAQGSRIFVSAKRCWESSAMTAGAMPNTPWRQFLRSPKNRRALITSKRQPCRFTRL